MWSTVFSALTAGICILCLGGCVLVVRNAARVSESQAATVRSHTSQIASVKESLSSTAEELELLANRVKMMRVRNKTDHAIEPKVASRNGGGSPGGEPDPYTDPDGWRQSMNEKIARARHGL